MKTLSRIALAGAACVTQAQANTVVVDFNDIPMTASATTRLGPNGWSVELIPENGYTYRENGFAFTTDTGDVHRYAMTISAITDINPYYWTGSQGLFHSYGGSAQYSNSFFVSREDGMPFDLVSLDAAAFNNNLRALTVYGLPADGSPRVQANFVLDDSYNTLQTLTFGSTFKNLTMISFAGYGAQADNVTFSIAAVPEPEIYALMLAGLGLVACAARRRQA